MAKGSGRRLSRHELQEMWSLWKSGESLREIGRVLGRHPRSLGEAVAKKGGVAPVPRTRSARALTLQEREHISRGIVAGISLTQLAQELARPTSTISREVARNGGKDRYRAVAADERAWVSAKRPKLCRMAVSKELRDLVASKLELDWSPTQISRWLKLEHPGNRDFQVSHETIYRTLFIQARGALRKELTSHLRTQRKLRRSKKSASTPDGRGQIKGAISVRERPAEAEDRAVPGHWEGDLIAGAANSHVATLVERSTRFVMLQKVNGKDTVSVVTALKRRIKKLPEQLKRSLTWDRGMEMAGHADFTIDTKVQVYFCDPHSPWQRGSNENTNGLLRQYLPRDADLTTFSQAQLDMIALRLNQRPRETLGFRTPAFKLAQALQ
jgi:IS30 family transposase